MATRTYAIAVLFLASCGSGKSTPDAGTPHSSAPADGPGDTARYFPVEVGDRWWFTANVTPASGRSTVDFDTVTAARTATVLGRSATVFSEQLSSSDAGAVEASFEKLNGGVNALGSGGPADFVTPNLVPYAELLFPVEPGPVASIDRGGFDAGVDLDGDGTPETYQVTLQTDIAGFEGATVLAGTFPRCAKRVTTMRVIVHYSRAQTTAQALELQRTSWLAPGVGIVRQTTAVTLADGTTHHDEIAARGYALDVGVRGVALPATVVDALAPVNGFVPQPAGIPSIARSAAAYCVLALQSSHAGALWNAQWTASVVGADGAAAAATAVGPRTTMAGDTLQSALASDGDGWLSALEFDDAASQRTGIAGARISAGGTALDALTIASAWSDSPAAAFDGANYLVIYRRLSGLDFGQLFAVRVSPAGQVGSEFPITSAEGFPAMPKVACDGTNCLAVWAQGAWNGQPAGIIATRVPRTGGVLDESGIVLASSGDRPAIAFGGGKYLVLWGGKGISGRLVSADASMQAPFVLGTEQFAAAPAAAYSSGEYWAAWMGVPFIGTSNIMFARVSQAGAIIDAPANGHLLAFPDGRRAAPQYPAIATAADGGLLVWYEATFGLSARVAGLAVHPFGP